MQILIGTRPSHNPLLRKRLIQPPRLRLSIALPINPPLHPTAKIPTNLPLHLTSTTPTNIPPFQHIRVLFGNPLSFPHLPQLGTPADRNKAEVGGNSS